MTKPKNNLAAMSETVGVLCVRGPEILVLEDTLNGSWTVPQGVSHDETGKAAALRLAQEQLHVALTSGHFLGMLEFHSVLKLEPEQAQKAGYRTLSIDWAVFDGNDLTLPEKPGGVQRVRWGRLDGMPTHCPQGYAPLYQGLTDAVHGFMRLRRVS